MTLEKPKTVADVLEAAADLIEPEGAWTQGVFHDWKGADSKPCASCIAGAVMLAAGDQWDRVSAPSVPSEALGFPAWSQAMDWNDDPERTQAEVVAKLREAASLSRQNEEKANGETAA